MPATATAKTQAATLQAHTLTYRKFKSGRGFDWVPQGTEWQTEASAYLVCHDLYHHTAQDSGSFTEEVATFGAEWYVNIEPLKAGQAPDLDDVKGQQRACLDVLEGMLVASKNPESFALALGTFPAMPGTADALMLELGAFGAHTLISAEVLAKADKQAFAESFRQHCRSGYWSARARFPDQKQVRGEFKDLLERIVDLADDEDRLPEGYDLTLVREGMRTELQYVEDADAELKADGDVLEVLVMPWTETEGRMPTAGISLHQTELGFVELVERYFDETTTEQDPIPASLIPLDTSARLQSAYIKGAELIATIQAGGAVWLTVDRARDCDYSPRGRPVYSA